MPKLPSIPALKAIIDLCKESERLEEFHSDGSNPRVRSLLSAKVNKCFEKIGYEVIRQRGSHIRLHHKIDKNKKPLTIPRHKTLGRGLLRKLLRDAEISIEDFISLL